MMTDEEIEVAATKAGGRWNGSLWVFEDADLHPFVRTVLAAEREACANLCDARYMGDNNREDMEARSCAAAIRAQ